MDTCEDFHRVEVHRDQLVQQNWKETAVLCRTASLGAIADLLVVGQLLRSEVDAVVIVDNHVDFSQTLLQKRTAGD